MLDIGGDSFISLFKFLTREASLDCKQLDHYKHIIDTFNLLKREVRKKIKEINPKNCVSKLDEFNNEYGTLPSLKAFPKEIRNCVINYKETSVMKINEAKTLKVMKKFIESGESVRGFCKTENITKYSFSKMREYMYLIDDQDLADKVNSIIEKNSTHTMNKTLCKKSSNQ